MIVTKPVEVKVLAETSGSLGGWGVISASGVHGGLHAIKGTSRDGVEEAETRHIRTRSHRVSPIMMTTKAIHAVSNTETRGGTEPGSARLGSAR